MSDTVIMTMTVNKGAFPGCKLGAVVCVHGVGAGNDGFYRVVDIEPAEGGVTFYWGDNADVEHVTLERIKDDG